MRFLITLPVVAALVCVPAFAQEPSQPAEDKVICKRHETFMTGTRLSRPKKVCMKASEWKQSEDEKDRTMRRVQDGKVSPDQPATLGGSSGG
mgnify:CR=1 FL=1